MSVTGRRIEPMTSVMRGRIEPARIAWVALALAMVGAAVLIFHFTRGTTLWFDEWNWALHRRGGGIDSLLQPYNGHFSLVPVAIYKVLFAVEGISTSAGYRIALIAGHLLCAGLVFVYMRRRVGDYLALLGAVVLLFLGPAWQDILWPFQVGWLIPVAAGVAALLLLERRDLPGDVGAAVLLTVSVASASVGVPILVGAIVEVAWVRRRWRDGWVVAVPAVLYVAWSLGYQNSHLVANDIFAVPRWAASSAAAALSVLTGLSGQTISNDAGTVLVFGVPLAVAGLALVLWRTLLGGRWPVRAVSLAVMAVSFWVLTAVGRAFLGQPYSSRYEYVDCVFVLLFAAELSAGLVVRRWLALALGVVAVASVVSNIGIMREAGGYLRGQAPIARADLAALEIGRAVESPTYVATAFPGYPFLTVRAGDYFAMKRSIGTPAYGVAALTTAPPQAQAVADTELVRIHAAALAAGRSSPALGPPPPVEQGAGITGRVRGSCEVFAPAAFLPTGQSSQLQLRLPAAGLRISAGGQPVSVGLRRFAPYYYPIGALGPNSSATLRIGPDAAPQPWHVQLSGNGPVTICGMGP